MSETSEAVKVEDIVTDNVLQQIINGYNPNLSLVSWEKESGSKLGDNYTTIMYAVDLVLEDKSRNKGVEGNAGKIKLPVMLKTMPRNPTRAEMMNETGAFKKEATIYHEVLPSFTQFMQEKGIPTGDLFRAWPTCYAAHFDGRSDFLALENLKVSGYEMGNRVTGMDFNHCSMALRNLARYHAISYVKFGGSREKIVEAFPLLGPNTFDKNRKLATVQRQFFSQSFKSQAESMREMGDELAAARLEALSAADVCDVLGGLISRDNECTIITHGDFWVNNMMFQYNTKQEPNKEKYPLDVKFIDFQICQPSSRFLDIYYFLLTSSKFDLLNGREEDLLMIYYAEFTSFVERLGVNTKEKGLTWERFLEEGKQYKLFGVFFGILIAPISTADSSDVSDFETWKPEDFENAGGALKKFFKNMTKDLAIHKTRNIVINHLPKCANVEQYV